MKKLGIVLAIVTALALVGCGSTGGGGGGRAAAGGGGGGAPFVVDLSTLKTATVDGTPTGGTVRNPQPFTKNYDDLMILFSDLPDVTQYQRITIRCKYFNEAGEEIAQGDSNAMVSLIYDLSADIRGPDMGPGPNTPLKEFNVGGFSGAVSTDRGVRVRLTKAPVAILFQNSNVGVKFIEASAIVFHNGDFKSE